MLNPILDLYGIDGDRCAITPFGTGLINKTWKVTYGSNRYILQRINNNVFKDPYAIASNLDIIEQYLSKKNGHYLFVNSVKSASGKSLVRDTDHGYFRLMPFVSDSYTFDTVTTPEIAFEAANQFGLFTKLLAQMDLDHLQITLPDFHNLSLRYQQFETALSEGNKERIARATEEIRFIKQHSHIVDIFENIKQSKEFKVRVTHHDTKISNVLFNREGKGLCVIDLDTTMPGYFISDVGDMMRTYLSPVSEEEKDFSKISIRDEYFDAIARGYLGQMKDELTAEERDHFVYSGAFIIYMQAMRFLTDHLNNDIYYGAKEPDHNFTRAGNQIALLRAFVAKQDALENKVRQL